MTSNFSPTRLVHQSDEGGQARALFFGVSCLVDGMIYYDERRGWLDGGLDWIGWDDGWRDEKIFFL